MVRGELEDPVAHLGQCGSDGEQFLGVGVEEQVGEVETGHPLGLVDQLPLGSVPPHHPDAGGLTALAGEHHRRTHSCLVPVVGSLRSSADRLGASDTTRTRRVTPYPRVTRESIRIGAEREATTR